MALRSTDLEVLAQGTKVKIRLGNVEAVISAISIRHKVVTYELTYYFDGKYDYITLPEQDFELVGNSTSYLNIGFRHEGV